MENYTSRGFVGLPKFTDDNTSIRISNEENNDNYTYAINDDQFKKRMLEDKLQELNSKINNLCHSASTGIQDEHEKSDFHMNIESVKHGIQTVDKMFNELCNISNSNKNNNSDIQFSPLN